MCYYLTATLDGRADVEALRELAKDNDSTFEPLENSHVKKQLGASMKYYLTTKGECDCGTVWGAGNSAAGKKDIGKEVRKLERKGWSDCKIARWKEDKAKVGLKKETRSKLEYNIYESSVKGWMGLISSALNEGLTSHIGILLQWYSGKVQSERIDIKKVIEVRLGELTGELIWKAEEDTLYKFVK